MQKYEELKLEVIRFKSADVVTASGRTSTQDNDINTLIPSDGALVFLEG